MAHVLIRGFPALVLTENGERISSCFSTIDVETAPNRVRADNRAGTRVGRICMPGGVAGWTLVQRVEEENNNLNDLIQRLLSEINLCGFEPELKSICAICHIM